VHGGLIGGMLIHRKDQTHRLKNAPFETQKNWPSVFDAQ